MSFNGTIISSYSNNPTKKPSVNLNVPSVVNVDAGTEGICTNPMDTTKKMNCQSVCSVDNSDDCVVYFKDEKNEGFPVLMNSNSMGDGLFMIKNITNHAPEDAKITKIAFDIPDYLLPKNMANSRRTIPTVEHLAKLEEDLSSYTQHIEQIKKDRDIITENPTKYFRDLSSKQRRSSSEERIVSLNVLELDFAEIFEYWEKIDKYVEDSEAYQKLKNENSTRRNMSKKPEMPDEPKDYEKKYKAIEYGAKVIGVGLVAVGGYNLVGGHLDNWWGGIRGFMRLLSARKNYARDIKEFYEKYPDASVYYYHPRKPNYPSWGDLIFAAVEILGWTALMVVGVVVAFTAEVLGKDDVFYNSEDFANSGLVIGSKLDVLENLKKQGYYMDGEILRDPRGYPVTDENSVPISFASDSERRIINNIKDFGTKIAKNPMLKSVPRKEYDNLLEGLDNIPPLPSVISKNNYISLGSWAILATAALIGTPIMYLAAVGLVGYKYRHELKSLIKSTFWQDKSKDKFEILKEQSAIRDKKSSSSTDDDSTSGELSATESETDEKKKSSSSTDDDSTSGEDSTTESETDENEENSSSTDDDSTSDEDSTTESETDSSESDVESEDREDSLIGDERIVYKF